MIIGTREVFIRKASPEDAGGMARVRVDTWRQAYAGLLPDGVLASLSVSRTAELWRKNILEHPEPGMFALVAENVDGEVIGILIAGAVREPDEVYRGEIGVLYVLPEYQRQGIGRSLFEEGARRLRKQGFNNLLVWVLENNPWRAFYEALKGRVVRRRMVNLGDYTAAEVGYGWDDLSKIVKITEDLAGKPAAGK